MKLRATLAVAAVSTLLLAGAFPVAAAASTKFHAARYPAAVSGEQLETQTLTLEGEAKVKCKHVTFSGVLEEASETLTVAPSYSECTMAGLAATVSMNGCTFVFKGGAKVESNASVGTQDISCPAGQSILVVALSKSCEAKVGAQTGLSAVTYRDDVEATPVNLKVEEGLSSVHYTVAKDEGACPLSGTGEKTNGGLNGSGRLKGSVGAEAVALGIAEAGTVRLCTEKPVNFACPKVAYAAGTKISAALNGGGVAKLRIIEAGAEKNLVECKQSSISAETSEIVGNPVLNVKKISVLFPKGQCATVPGKTACEVVMKNAGAVAGAIELAPPVLLPNEGEGLMNMEMAFTVECGAEMQKCEFTREVKKHASLLLAQGAPVTLEASATLPFEKKVVVGEKGCFEAAEWSGSYEVTAPKPIWVTV